MNKIIEAAVANNRTTLGALFVIFVLGIIAYASITKENDPDIPIPYFQIDIVHDGISPEDAERLLIKPIEVQMRSISGLKEMTSIGREGSASVILEFYPSADHTEALADVRDALDSSKAELPNDTDEPILFEFNPAEEPIMAVVFYGTAPERTFTNLARQVKDGLESLPNVLRADISGTREEVLEIVIDPVKLAAYNLTPAELLTAVSANNRLIAAGAIDTNRGRFTVKVPGIFETRDDIMSLPLKTSADGVVTVADITEVRRTFKDPFRLSRMNGKPAVTIEVAKRIGTNVIETSDMVRAALEKSRPSWPAGVEIAYLYDQSDFIRDFLASLENSVLSAVLLVAVVIIAALGLRSGAIVCITIPGSFLLAIMTLYYAGYSINIVVMFALILAVGMLVDGAIVVSEYADRKMLEGLPKREAYVNAAQRMAWPVISSTLTTLAAFFPLLFWPDIVGEYMKFLPVTLIFVLSASLLMAMLFLPMLGSLFGRPGPADPNVMASLAGDSNMDLTKLKGYVGTYARIVAGIVRSRTRSLAVGLGAVGLLVGIWGAYIFINHGTEFFPNGEPDNVRLNVHARGNLSPAEMDRIAFEVENLIKDVDGIENIYSTSGPRIGGSRRTEDVVSRINVIFKDWDKRRKADLIIDEIRARTAVLPGIVVEPEVDQNGPSSGKDIQINISSEIPRLMDSVVDRVRARMEGMEGLVDVEDSRPLPSIQWVMEVDRSEAARYNTNIATVGSIIQLVTNGIKVGEYRPDDAEDELDIRARFPLADRGIEQLGTLLMPTAQGNIPISNFVKRVPKQNVSQIRRVDSERVWEVRANAETGVNVNEQVEAVKAWIAAQNFDPRVRVEFGGADEQQRESEVFLMQAFGIAVFLMALILVTQFNSFYRTFLILTAVIMSTIGVIFGLIVTGKPFGIVMTGVGVISLAGIIVNNNIILIDTYARLIREGIEPIEAIIRTGAQRLRPVFLTSITTVVGLVPMVFQFDIDFFNRKLTVGAPTAFIWVDLAQAISFGLVFGTVLTLVLTPVFLALPVHFKARRAVLRAEGRLLTQRLRRRFGSKPKRAPAE